MNMTKLTIVLLTLASLSGCALTTTKVVYEPQAFSSTVYESSVDDVSKFILRHSNERKDRGQQYLRSFEVAQICMKRQKILTYSKMVSKAKTNPNFSGECLNLFLRYCDPKNRIDIRVRKKGTIEYESCKNLKAAVDRSPILQQIKARKTPNIMEFNTCQ